MQKNKTDTNHFPLRRIQLGLILAVGGFLILMVGTRPDLFLLDRSPVLGFVQVAVMLVGLAVICLGGYICLSGLWKGRAQSIACRARRTHHQHRLHHCSFFRPGGYLRARQPPLSGIHPVFWRMAGARRSDRRRPDRYRSAADAALFPTSLLSQPPKPARNRPPGLDPAFSPTFFISILL